MKLVKELEHSLLLKHFSLGGKHYLSVTGMLYYDLEEQTLLKEQDLWKDASQLIRSDQPLDEGYAKEKGEVVMYGHCYPQREVRADQVGFKVGNIEKRLNVFGNRYFTKETFGAIQVSEPEPFTKMKVSFSKAFGGMMHKQNPIGKGYCEDIDDRTIALPNIEDPGHLVTSPKDDIVPQSFEPLSLGWERRMAKAGTYDEEWKQTRWPYFADDIDISIFNTTLPDQQQEGFFTGEDEVEYFNMHPQKQKVSSTLPGKRLRMFLTKEEKNGEEQFFEVANNIDTLIIFSDFARIAIVYRGVAEVADDEYSDIKRAFFVTEDIAADKKPLSYYQELEAQKRDKSVKLDNEKFAQMRKDHDKAMKNLRDMPMKFNTSLKQVQGKAPRLSPFPTSALENGLQKYDTYEQQLKDIISDSDAHEKKVAMAQALLESFTKSGFREKLANLGAIPKRLANGFKEIESSTNQSYDNELKRMKEIEKSAPNNVDFSAQAAKIEAAKKKLGTMTALGDDAVLKASMIESWSDGAGYFAAERAKELQQTIKSIEQIEQCKLRGAALEASSIGFGAKSTLIGKELWKQKEEFVIPPGFILPYYKENKTVALVVRPQLFDEEGNFIGDIHDKLVSGSDESHELVLSGGKEDAIVLVNDYIEAWLLHQELWDVCCIGVFKDETSFMKSDYIKNAKQLQMVIGIYTPLKEQTYEVAQLKLHKKSILDDYGDERDFKGDVIHLLPESDAKYALQREQRKKKRMGKMYTPGFNAKQYKSDFEKAMRHNFDTKYQEGMQDVQKALENSQANIDGQSLPDGVGNIDLKALASQAQNVQKGHSLDDIAQLTKEKLLSNRARLIEKMGEGTPALGMIDDALVKLDTQFSELKAIQPRIEEALKPVREMKAKGVIPDWAKKSFKNAFGRELGEKGPVFESAEEVKAWHEAQKSFKYGTLKGLELEGMDFKGADFSEANLNGVSFKGTNLEGCNFYRAKLSGADLTHAVCDNASFENALLPSAVLNNASFRGATLKSALLKGCECKDACFDHAIFDKATLTETSLNNVAAENATMKNMIFTKGEIANSTMEEVSFEKALFYKAKISDTVLNKATLKKMKLVSTPVMECEMKESNSHNLIVIKGSSFDHCSFEKSDLSKSYFSEVEVAQCDFSRSNIASAYWHKDTLKECSLEKVHGPLAMITNSVFLGCNLNEVNLMQGSLKRTELNNTTLVNANLFSCKFMHNIFKEADFMGANLKRTNLQNGRETLYEGEILSSM